MNAQLIRRRLVVSTLVAVLLAAATSFYLAIRQSSPSSEASTAQDLGSATPADDTKEQANIMNIALLGIGGEGHSGGSLTDTIMLASVNLDAGKAVVFSVPRDLYLQRADGSGQRINAALADASSPTDDGTRIKSVFADAFGVHVDYFVRLDFQAFVQAIDALGGINVHFARPLHDPNFKREYAILDFEPGTHLLDGRAALYVARSRKTSARGDLDRAARQRAILAGLTERLMSVETLASPDIIRQLVQAQRQHVQTDLGTLDLLRLFQAGRSMNADDILKVGFEDSPKSLLAHARINGADVLVPRRNNVNAVKNFVQQSMQRAEVAPDAYPMLAGVAEPQL